ncbi:hypothetical protein VNO77_17245 [Canavalia gladiata]|uniref:Uncharacterized protein n=1 Tax=Canavalia gladiata TaxID=3824 RepID=A0AAN9LM47_CANGL
MGRGLKSPSPNRKEGLHNEAAQAQLLLSQFHGISVLSKHKTVPSFITVRFTRQVNSLSNGMCQSLFCDMKRDPIYDHSIAPYNILISVFGGMMLVDHMEATFQR